MFSYVIFYILQFGNFKIERDFRVHLVEHLVS